MVILTSLTIFPLLIFVIYSLYQNYSIINQVKRDSLKTSISSLNASTAENMELMTVDIAKELADFLYGRDIDVRYLAKVAGSLNGDIKSIENAYSTFINSKTKRVAKQNKWTLSEEENRWVRENNEDEVIDIPMYDEVTFIGLDGLEKIKIGTANFPNSSKISYADYFKTGDLKDVSLKENTFIKAETYYPALETLTEKEGNDIYVSDVIGAYVGTNFAGMYTKRNLDSAAKKLGYKIEFTPEKQAFATEENPVGKRFEGIVRWASPVYVDGKKIGYVTIALSQDHIMKFVDHKTPTKIWDYQTRSIAHPRHHSIYGFDPETGEEQIPWLMATEYDMLLEKSGISKKQAEEMTSEQRFSALKSNWKNLINNDADKTGKPVYELIKEVPIFKNQERVNPNDLDLDHTPATDLTRLGYIGLDGRYLNNAPQCIGALDLTRNGGSGSFYVLWSGLYKMNTVAAIPYYTGRYAPSTENNYSKVGFGFVAIGSGIEYFTDPAKESVEAVERYLLSIKERIKKHTIISLIILLIIIFTVSIVMSNWLSANISFLFKGIDKYRMGWRQYRFNSQQKSEFGKLAKSFDMLAENIEQSISHPIFITTLEKNIMYVNKIGMSLCKITDMDAVIGKPYAKYGLYPEKTEYDPFYAYENETETAVYHDKTNDIYIKGKVMPFLDDNNVEIGYIVESYDVTKIEKQNRVLEEQRDKLEEIQVELKEALIKAQEATNAKSVFLANMSHEIRTPLNAIIGFAKTELKNKLPPSTVGSIENIYNSSKILLNIVNDILDISKIEANKIDLNCIEYDFPSILNDVITMNLMRIEEKPVRLRAIIDKNIPEKLYGDELRLKQIFNNLLSNAIKYSNSGTITLSIESKLEKVSRTEVYCNLSCYVQDMGAGISEENLSNLFADYQTANTQAHRNATGTGLGLVICKKLIQMMDGNISVESKLNQGSKFSFNVKIKAVGEKPIGEEIADNFMSLKYVNLMSERNESFLYEEMPYGQVLIVDDVGTNLQVAKVLMEPYKINIDTAMSGSEVLNKVKIQKKVYDVIFMDYMMPKMNGVETTKILREADYKGTIVVLTANAVVGSDKMFTENGFNDFLSKPIDIKKLDVILKKYVYKSEKNRTLATS
jgi:signal transduction histidine kinase/CheY-like chemotaxis protein